MLLEPTKKTLEQKFYDLSVQILKAEGLVLYDFEYFPAKGLLRLFIMEEETQNAKLDDCVRVDRAFGPFMETETWIPDNFILEVSSPGINRVLKTPEHFAMAVGKKVCLVMTKTRLLQEPKELKGQKKFVGILEKISSDAVFLKIPIKGKTFEAEFAVSEIKKANLDPEFP